MPVLPDPAPLPAAPAPNPLTPEAGLLGGVLRALGTEGNPARALVLLDEYDTRFPRGALRSEATLARVQGLQRLGREQALITLLDGSALESVPRSGDLRVLRGELRLAGGRVADAMRDFSDVLSVLPEHHPLAARALYGRAAGRSQAGDTAGARADLESYVRRFPNGPHADAVRGKLAH
jgi:hypothetical protein